jgi:hypothetical protein
MTFTTTATPIMTSEPKHQKTGNGRTEVFSGKDAVHGRKLAREKLK